MQNYSGGEHKSGSGKGFPSKLMGRGLIFLWNIANALHLTLLETPFEIHQGQVRQEFEKLHHDGKSLLTASDLPEDKYIVFCGLLELTNRACVHFELRNPTQKTILFNIRTPISHCFFVKPHVGMIEAGGKAKIYCTFKGKCHRVPSDYCMIYSIYHIVIDEKSTALIKEDEFSSSNLRAVWNKKGRGVEIKNILHLSCKFDEKAKPEHTCKHHKIGRIIDLNDHGETILFNIRTPISHCFFVKPHVGMIEAGGKAKIYCTFKGKCHRVPSDYCMIYSIYHIVIDEKSTALIKEDEFSSSNLRAVWNKKGRGVEIKNILHLSCKFDEKAKPEHTCKHHKIGRIIDLNDHGEVVQASPLEDSKGEPSNTPPSATAKGRRLQKTPSVISTEEMPKTATSEKTKKK
ncbi:hypothetical protein CRE_02695 [Caenorhabditis remanei]|uniref:Major sperm protein n=1 Tax=Caenorhabditis remanei TaxID=31234 RepID=E3NKJ1_CAERE|nr:hypothetical protein CRE_02695 [Caenorhabditis remanei]